MNVGLDWSWNHIWTPERDDSVRCSLSGTSLRTATLRMVLLCTQSVIRWPGSQHGCSPATNPSMCLFLLGFALSSTVFVVASGFVVVGGSGGQSWGKDGEDREDSVRRWREWRKITRVKVQLCVLCGQTCTKSWDLSLLIYVVIAFST